MSPLLPKEEAFTKSKFFPWLCLDGSSAPSTRSGEEGRPQAPPRVPGLLRQIREVHSPVPPAVSPSAPGCQRGACSWVALPFPHQQGHWPPALGAQHCPPSLRGSFRGGDTDTDGFLPRLHLSAWGGRQRPCLQLKTQVPPRPLPLLSHHVSQTRFPGPLPAAPSARSWLLPQFRVPRSLPRSVP